MYIYTSVMRSDAIMWVSSCVKVRMDQFSVPVTYIYIYIYYIYIYIIYMYIGVVDIQGPPFRG